MGRPEMEDAKASPLIQRLTDDYESVRSNKGILTDYGRIKLYRFGCVYRFGCISRFGCVSPVGCLS
jgi:hypothetical protein